MSFTRLKYDLCEEKTYLNETVRPGKYWIGEPLNCGTCFQPNPSIIMQKSGISLQKGVPWRFNSGPVDVESELKNLSRPASKCPSGKYNPKCSKCKCDYQGQPCGKGVSGLCPKCQKMCGDNLVDFPDCFFPVEHTRLNSCAPRGVGLNRFEFPCKNPQANLEFPGCWREPSRTIFRDNYKPCYRKPKVNDMTPPSYRNSYTQNKLPMCYNVA